jgi:HK97 family phage portal protein
MFDRFRNAWTAMKAAPPGSKAVTLITEIFGGIFKGMEGQKIFDFASYLKAGSKNCWALFRAMDIIAKVCMDTPWRLQRKGGDKGIVVIKEITALFESPNPFMNGVELFYLTAGHLVLTGNAFWLKDEVNFENKRPGKLWPLNPKRMSMVIDPTEGLVGYVYRVDGREVPLDLDEIIHIKIPHVNNDHWGCGVVESGEDLFQGFLNRQEWEGKFWKNGAAPSGVLVCEQQITDKKKWEEAKEEWRKEYSGGQNSGKVAWLTGKWQFLKLGLSKVEMQDIESDRWTVNKIFIHSGVPLSVAGIENAAAYATARIDDLRFRRYSIKPILTFLAATVTSDLVADWNDQIEMQFEISGLVDLDGLRENLLPLFDRGGCSINELRDLYGFQPDPDNALWEAHYINAGLVPLDLAGVTDQGQTQQQAQAAVRRFVEQTIAGNGAKRIETALLKLIEISGSQQKLLSDVAGHLVTNGNGHSNGNGNPVNLQVELKPNGPTKKLVTLKRGDDGTVSGEITEQP